MLTLQGSHAVKVMTALFGPTDAINRARVLRDAGAGGLDLMTDVAIALPRNSIHLAHQAIEKRSRADLAIVPEVIVSVSSDQNPDHASTRRLLAFYGSTPAYKPVLDVHGWG
jgi:hypothetical protein